MKMGAATRGALLHSPSNERSAPALQVETEYLWGIDIVGIVGEGEGGRRDDRKVAGRRKGTVATGDLLDIDLR